MFCFSETGSIKATTTLLQQADRGNDLKETRGGEIEIKSILNTKAIPTSFLAYTITQNTAETNGLIPLAVLKSAESNIKYAKNGTLYGWIVYHPMCSEITFLGVQ